MYSQMNLLKTSSIIVVLVFGLFHMLDKENVTNSLHQKSSLQTSNITQNDKPLTDTMLLGFWGYEIPTNNCVLWIVVDSLYFVDTDSWYKYSVYGDTIIMSYDAVEYLKANFQVDNDSLILRNEDMTIRYGKCKNHLH